MHEMSIALEIVTNMTQYLAEYPGGRIDEVCLEIGEYSGVDIAALEYCLPAAGEDSGYRNVAFRITKIPLTVTCFDCNAVEKGRASLRCPRCGSANVRATSGRDITIISVKITLPDK